MIGERLGYHGAIGVLLIGGGIASSFGSFVSYIFTTAEGLQQVADEGEVNISVVFIFS